jgi:hypothetical protein
LAARWICNGAWYARSATRAQGCRGPLARAAGLRFAGRFEFEIDRRTWDAIVESRRFSALSRERVRQEIEDDGPGAPAVALTQPLATVGRVHVAHSRVSDVPDVAFAAADYIGTPDATGRPELAQARRRNRLATLFLDLAPANARRTLEGLRASNRETDWITHQVTSWSELGASIRDAVSTASVTDAALRRWAATIGRIYFGDFIRVALARWSAEAGSKALKGVASLYRRGTRMAFHDPLSIGDLAIDGTDLMELGIPAGPAVGATLRRLLEVVVDDPSKNQRDTLLALARSSNEGAAR